MARKKRMSKVHYDIIDKLKMGWYLQQDMITLMWQIKNEELSKTERINKNSVNILFENKLLKKLPVDNRSNYELYILKE